ncbi:MAG: hypothetical protein U1E76_00580 [Planctomycetota bacterium]
MFKGLDLSAASRLRKASAEAMVERMAAGDLAFTQAPRLDDHGHSSAIVAVDARGNIAAVVHSINTSAWGGTGIFVDGISIPDSASFQQAAVRRAGKGEQLPDPTEPLIVMQDGAPICALASIGAGLHEKTFCVLVDLLDHDLGIKAAIDAPAILLPAFGAGGMRTPRSMPARSIRSCSRPCASSGWNRRSCRRAISRPAAGWWEWNSILAPACAPRLHRPRSTALPSASDGGALRAGSQPASTASQSFAIACCARVLDARDGLGRPHDRARGDRSTHRGFPR